MAHELWYTVYYIYFSGKGTCICSSNEHILGIVLHLVSHYLIVLLIKKYCIPLLLFLLVTSHYTNLKINVMSLGNKKQCCTLITVREDGQNVLISKILQWSLTSTSRGIMSWLQCVCKKCVITHSLLIRWWAGWSCSLRSCHLQLVRSSARRLVPL